MDKQGRIGFEVTLHPGKASRLRLGTCLLEQDVDITDRFRLGEGGDWFVLLWMHPKDIQAVRETLRPYAMRYRSPVYFDRSCICSVYATPEDEVSGIERACYIEFKARRAKEVRDE